ncbi:Pre-mRNA-splicing factor slt11 [Microbotryomycetes sp. JL201]|nr:Pre-mRNA-splicing factor slt11 [Microbotryomycetes sp. JL201]
MPHGPKSDLNKAGVEQGDFPVLCETCLGPNPFKKTEICQTCARSKNCCQTCLLDLQFGLPTQVRDAALGQRNQAPTSNINREYYAQNVEANLEDAATGAVNFGKADSAAKDLLKRLARTDPGYKRNRPRLCTFYAKGACNRGDECPYRHELPVENELAHQNIRDRYYGTDDPVARKIMNKHASDSGLTPPLDQSIASTKSGPEHTSLFLTALPPTATEESIKAWFVANGTPGQSIKSVVLVSTSKVAFVNFVSRTAAEDAAGRCSLGVKVDGQDVKVAWGRSRPKKTGAQSSSAATGALSSVAQRELETTGS